ncbi:hypothetical protein Pint_14855 [Pistacia integerrima]|uniref:Uncharacterized protein n=1 Tax=Pistacia integerrima TaxID=434235 RepID=A0ACC0ZGC3_9ROSI|nr:hypothetical protein Pint_14855 [Pistacia integerrima]
MGRALCCSKQGLHRGPWSAEEDTLLINYIRVHGEGDWRNLPARADLICLSNFLYLDRVQEDLDMVRVAG